MAVETRQPTILNVTDALRWLEALPQNSPVLSMFVDASPSRVDGGAFLVAFRAGVQQVRNGLEEADRPAFDASAAALERYINSPFVPPARGFAGYAAPERDPIVVALPFAPMDEVVWTDRPVIEPLVQALDDHERVAVVLIDKERTRFFTIALGEIEERQSFIDEVDGKHAGGGWHGLAQKRFARHHEDQVLRHVKRTAGLLVDELRKHPYDRLFIGGADEAVSLLRHHLPKPVAQRFTGSVRLELFASDAEVLSVSLALAEQAERAAELEAVREVMEANDTHALVGLENSLQALFTGRVSRLLVSDLVPRAGRVCDDCGRLTSMRPCPICMGETSEIPDLRERAIERAVQLGARIDIVHGEAAATLIERGGVAAWTRRSEH